MLDLNLKTIVIYHPAAIGDAVLATVVPVVLRQNFPDAKIFHLTHKSLLPLLSLCTSINSVIAFDKDASLLKQRQQIAQLSPDLLIDLTGSNSGFIRTVFGAKTILRYRKQPANEKPILHAVDNFIKTLSPLSCKLPASYFPSLNPPEIVFAEKSSSEKFFQQIHDMEKTGKEIIACVPGVGKFRPHRAWPKEKWVELISQISSYANIVLVGGDDEVSLCDGIVTELGKNCLSLAGHLSLPETASLLKKASLVISGDTGPAHIAVAVGTKVVGLTGPTYPERSGPYGMQSYGISESHDCQCHANKTCQLNTEPGPGECMKRIDVQTVYNKVNSILKSSG